MVGHDGQPALGAGRWPCSGFRAQISARMQVNKCRRAELQENKSRFSQATCASDRKPGKDTRCLQESRDGAGDQWE